jgi:hypothetical protein
VAVLVVTTTDDRVRACVGAATATGAAATATATRRNHCHADERCRRDGATDVERRVIDRRRWRLNELLLQLCQGSQSRSLLLLIKSADRAGRSESSDL